MSTVQQLMTMMQERYPNIYALKSFQHKWSYDIGVVLKGIEEAYLRTTDARLLAYIEHTMDAYVEEDGSICYYKPEEMNIDYLNNGKILLFLSEYSSNPKYEKAAHQLWHQLEQMPRTKEGGFWHKKIYPEQMWLDGLYMGAPFYAAYSKKYRQGQDNDDIVHQFELCFEHMRDEKTGLLYHAWDSSRTQFWANPTTGLSPHFWGRSMGWYVLALIDTIAILPETYEKRDRLVEIYTQVMTALFRVRDEVSHVWYQVLELPKRTGNYLEASASSMIVASAYKALNLGVLDATWAQQVDESAQGIEETFVLQTTEGWTNLIRNCEVAGLGGADKRDGSFTYYVSEPIVTNDFKGLGAYIQLCVAKEQWREKN